MIAARCLLARSLSLALLGIAAACAPGITKTTALTVVPPTAAPPTTPASTASPAAPVATAAFTGAYPGPVASATLDATQLYIVGMKATGLAVMKMTETAQPTQTPLPPTPTFPASAAPCRASDLAISDFTQTATGTVVVQVHITNVGRTVCYLQGPPDIQLRSQAGRPLIVHYLTACFLCINADPLATAMPAPTQTAMAQDRLQTKLGLGPGEWLGTTLLWNNFCQPFPAGGVEVRLMLPDASGVVNGPPDIPISGRCDAPGEPSTIVIGEYSRFG